MLSSMLSTALLVAATSAVPHGPPSPPTGPGHNGPPGPPGYGPPPGHPGLPPAPTAPAPPSPTGLQPYGFFVNSTIYATSGSEHSTYPRYTELSLSGHSPPYFPIFESKDGGASWKYISNLTDQVNGLGFAAQPGLTQLTFDIGAYKRGTILGTGNSWGSNSTNIDLYSSTDGARTWQFVSNIARGTRPNTTNGATPIWEPYLLPYDGELVAYYSDQRDSKYGQKLSHQTSTDLKTWGPVVNDVVYDDIYEARPGMTVVAYVPPIDKWVFVHERPIGNSSSYGQHYPVYYKLAKDPRDFRLSPDMPLVVGNKTAPNASPYVVWTPEPKGSKYGTIVVSDADTRSVFTNQLGGDIDAWEEHGTAAGAVYSRAIQILKTKPDHLLIYGGDTYDGQQAGEHIPFSASVFDINDVLKKGANDYSV
ncbi:hypothetical protein LTR78_001022 [Recurvomyces mirabilis]|uniref:Glycoside hydrolase family 93 protein n=1 Tax=Recurvomyces mirabilis TaxID=574656 RepID=A0AAE0WX60_9PEZI|nr:hypothetical protein LTR78_001022 [Recurvomyces mirabilis]KAK5158994.1 hypothetical protein LTS14_003102 [Recurvomyces mirabilis]